MTILRWIFCNFFLFAFSAFATAQTSIDLRAFENNASDYLGQSIVYFQTENGLKAADVFALPNESFASSKRGVLNLGVSQKRVWVKLKFSKHSIPEKQMNILIESLPLDTIRYFYKNAAGEIQQELSGFSQKQSTKSNYHRYYLLNIPTVTECPSQEVLLEIATPVQYFIPIRVGSFESFRKSNTLTELYYGVFFGFLLCMFLYNLLLFIRLNELSYFWYALSILTSLIVFSSFSGHLFQYILPNYPTIANKILLVGSGFLVVVTSKFIMHALELEKNSKKLKISYQVLVFVGFGIMAGVLIFGRTPLILPANLSIGILAVNIMITSLFLFYRGNKFAFLFFLAWLFYAFGGIMNILKNLGTLPYNEFTVHSGEIGCALEVVLIAFALGEKYRTFAEAKTKAQQAVISLQEQHNKTLEEKVLQRTQELTQANLSLKSTAEKLENQNITITESIHNAQNIQKSMLSISPDLRKKLGEHFILLKPRDIVSGDFYWFKYTDTTLIAAAIDCTGHGVPGAMMSMLGYNSLNAVTKKIQSTNPAELLNALHEMISSTLRQNTTRNRDGMDMSLIAFDTEKRILQFSGANNSGYLIYKGELVELKANNKSIGGRESDKPFSITELHLEEPATLYLFSDGYQDQFGGENGKKMMIRRVKEYILKYCTLPMEQQRSAFDTEFKMWVGNNEQIDDVLFMGLKL